MRLPSDFVGPPSNLLMVGSFVLKAFMLASAASIPLQYPLPSCMTNLLSTRDTVGCYCATVHTQNNLLERLPDVHQTDSKLPAY